ncbi:hypothetical protein Dda_8099 [Drechslerella dactyloides]|uniref:Galactose oxidase n=1 Tax=Drechslerella dactyloides TaxID=74499 RepID=A0AAD6NGE6_DREDA|nr:hypothetical protein Dda_8099 [Drechslerella dactyloides]
MRLRRHGRPRPIPIPVIITTLTALLRLLEHADAASTASLPIPAAVLRTWTASGSPLLHIQPAFHHSNASASSSIVSFRAVVLAEDTTIPSIDGTLLSNDSYGTSFSQDVAGIQIPNLVLPGAEAMLVFARDPRMEAKARVEDEAGDVWAMTFPRFCRNIVNSSLADYTLWRGGAGRPEWEPVKLDMQHQNLSVWFGAPRYLGRSFVAAGGGGGSSESTNDRPGKMYSFGGVCASGAEYTGNGRNDSFSNDVWRIENTTAEDTAGVDIAISKNPPIPEAGFSMTPLSFANASNSNGMTTAETGRMLILGGYTSLSRFVGFGQLAIYSLAREAWTFVSATVKQPGVTPRAGHSAVLDASGRRVVLFGGWVGNITRPAVPQLLSLKVGGSLDDDEWEWTGVNTTEEMPGVGPGDLSLWGHAATLLEGNIMLITSGFEVTNFDRAGEQTVNERTFYLNLTSDTWISSYSFPPELLARTAVEETKRQNRREIAILAGVFGGVIVLVALLTALFWYAKRKEAYADLPNNDAGSAGDKYHSLDLEYGKDIIVDGVGVPPINITHASTGPDEITAIQRLLRQADEVPRSPELPPRPAAPPPTHGHRREPSHVDMNRVGELRDRQERLENMVQTRADKRRSERSMRSEMVAWVREWANADAAAEQAADPAQRARTHLHPHSAATTPSPPQQQGQFLSVGRAERDRDNRHKGKQPASASPDNRCITSSSVYSEGQVSTLTASEIYDTTPVDEVPYPVPPLLLSTGEAADAEPRQHPRVLLSGPAGVTTPLPKKMAEEFPVPTVVPRDSVTSSSAAGVYRSGSGSAQQSRSHSSRSTQQLMPQSRNGSGSAESWRDVTPMDEHTPFYTIPLTTSRQPSRSLEDRVREEMNNPAPGRTEEECRLSSIMDFYAEESVPPTPVIDIDAPDDDEEGEERPFLNVNSAARSYSGERAMLISKGPASTVKEPAPPPPVGPSRESSVVAPLLSETPAESSATAMLRVDKATVNRSRMPSIGSSIRRRVDALLADKRVPSGSLGRRNVLHRRPQTAPLRPPISGPIALIQPQKAEIVEIERPIGTPFADDSNSSTDMRMDDKVVQISYTAPRGRLRVVNPSERSGSAGTDSSGLRRVSSAGAVTALAHGESIMRLGSAAARRFGELD